MVVVKPSDVKAPKPTQKPVLPDPSYDPIGNILRDRNEDALIAKNKEIIRAKYNQLIDLLGNYAAIKKAFDLRGKYIPPESYFHPEILYAGGVMDAANTVAATVIEGIASALPRTASTPPNALDISNLLDSQQQVTLIRVMNDVIDQTRAYLGFRSTQVTPTTTDTSVSTSTTTETPTVRLPQTVNIPQEILRPLRPQRLVRIRTRDLQTNLKPIDEVKYNTTLDTAAEEEPSEQDWNKPVKKFRDDYIQSIFTEGDYEGYRAPSTSSSSSSRVPTPTPILDLTGFDNPKGKPSLEHKEEPKYYDPTQTNKKVASQTLSVLNTILTDSRDLVRIKRTDKTRTTTEIKALIKNTWRDNTQLQKRVLGLLNLYGITVKSSRYLKGEVQKVVEKLIEMNTQMLNNFMNDLIKILENDSRNKLTFLFEPVTTDSGTLAVEGPEQLLNNVDFDNPALRQNFIDALKKALGDIDTRVAIQWFDALVKEIRQISFENFKNTTEYKSREWGLQLLDDGIESKLKQLIYNRSKRPIIKFDIDKIKKLVKIFMDALREPPSISGFQEIVNNPILTRVVDEVRANNIAIDTPFTQVDFDTATEEFDEMYGSESYDINTVIRTPVFEIKEVPPDISRGDEPPDPDEPNPVTEYELKVGKHKFNSNIRVIALLITLISTVTGATIKIVKTIKDEHKKDKKDDTPTSTESKQPTESKKPSPKPDSDIPVKDRPKRTKRHGDLP